MDTGASCSGSPTSRDSSGARVYQLLDDVPGASLVAGYSPELNRRDDVRTAPPVSERDADDGAPGHLLALTGVCAGWQEDGAIVTNVLAVGHVPIALGPEAPSLARPDDPLAWHDPPGPIPPHGMRRRRRIDVVPPTGDAAASCGSTPCSATAT